MNSPTRMNPSSTSAGSMGTPSSESSFTGTGAASTGSDINASRETSKAPLGDLAAKATDKLADVAQEQKQAGAEYMTSMAEAIRRAAGEFEGQMPEAARYIRYAADQVTTMSDSMRRRDIGQMISDVESFARRQPTAFLGMSLFAGFAAMRFIRSSASNASMSNSGMSNGMDKRYGDTRPGSMGSSMPGSTMGSDFGANRNLDQGF